MAENISVRLKRAWNVFMNRDPTLNTDYRGNGPGYGVRPDRVRLRRGVERSIVSAVYTRLAIDVAQMTIQHVRTDGDGGILEVIDSGLNRCFNEEANIDQTGRAFVQDLVLSMFDEGCVAAVPIDVSSNPDEPSAKDILTMRTAKIVEWRPTSVRVRAYNDVSGIHEEVEVLKRSTAIIENPLYAVMNEPNSTASRLVRKLNLLDNIDEQNGAGKLDLIIQLPYAVKGDLRKKQANERRTEMQEQLANSKFGVAYMDTTEKITQLNRPVENTLLAQIESLTALLFNQLGLTPEVFDGTADDKVMSNYYMRSVEPLVGAIVEEFYRKYIPREDRNEGHAIYYFRNPFKFIPVMQLAELTDKLTRNEVVAPNEIRRAIGLKTSADGKANELRNRNIAAPAEDRSVTGVQNGGTTDSKKYDFGGYATKNDLLCSDGVIIKKDAFKSNDGMRVPLVWQHQHNDPDNVLGHAILENRDNGVYAYCYFNDTPKGDVASKLVKHGDVTQLSIWAGRLRREANNVKHGLIREVSLVLSGANPGALIDTVITHGANDDDDNEGLEQGIIITGETIELKHAEEETGTRTLAEIMDTLNEEQKTAVNVLLGLAVEEFEDEDDEDDVEHSDNDEEGDGEVKYNLFDKGTLMHKDDGELVHSEEFRAALSFDELKRHGTLKESFLQHGIQDIEYLFPEARSLNTPPEFITRDMGWVSGVMSGVHKTPFSRIKSMFADLTEDEARARGYMKGTYKKEQFFTLLKRTTEAKTIYKKQKLDRDDVIDITDFDVVPWIKKEMRFMLDEEIARAILVGDGRPSDSEDKILEDKIRPIWKDDALYTIKTTVSVSESATPDQRAKAFIRSALKSRKDYRGSGNPVLYTTEDFLTDCLLLEDSVGRIIYDSVSKLATTLRVREIITVPIMEGLTRVLANASTVNLAGIIVNLNDYSVGADKGGSINMFEDFDIDYNQQKYLIETKISGALIRPYSAIALEFVEVEDEEEGV